MHDLLMERLEQATLEPAGSRKSIAEFLLREGAGVKVLAMGYSGWRDFRLAFLGMLEAREASIEDAAPDPNRPFTKDSSLEEAFASVSELKRCAVADAAAALDVEALAETARRVLAARSVVFFGAQPNCCLGELLACKLRRIGIFCQVPDETRWTEVAAALDQSDCAIVVSYSGVGPERLPVRLVTEFARARVPCVSVTNAGPNWLRSHSDCVLSFAPRERYYTKISGYYSEGCISLIFDALFSACLIENYERNEVLNQRMLVELERRRARRVEDVLPD